MNEKRNIQFSPPDISQLEIEQVVDTLKSGWITTGPKVKELEKRLADYLDTDRCVCLNSYTACAEMALRLLDIGPGDEVITCAYTYTATASVVCHVGAKVVLVDCQEHSLEMDYCQLENAITEKTKVIIPVDLAGIPCDYDKIFEIVNRKKVLFKPKGKLQEQIGRVVVMADAAHALGAEYKGKKVGSIADVTSFSFHAVKNFTTAEGGALTWNIANVDSDEIYARIQLLSLHGQSKDALAKTKMGAWEYDIVGPWYKCNMTDIMGALGLAQFERYPELLERRKEIISSYNRGLEDIVEVLTHYNDNKTSSGHLYITRVPGATRERCNEIMKEMAEAGIATNVHYKPLPMHTAYMKMGFDIKNYPNSYSHFINCITLPLHTKLSNDDVKFVIKKYREIIQKNETV